MVEESGVLEPGSVEDAFKADSEDEHQDEPVIRSHASWMKECTVAFRRQRKAIANDKNKCAVKPVPRKDYFCEHYLSVGQQSERRINLGTVDFIDRLEQLLEAILDKEREKDPDADEIAWDVDAYLKQFAKLHAMMKDPKYPDLSPDFYGNAKMPALCAAYWLLRTNLTAVADPKTKVHPRELRVWKRFYDSMDGEGWTLCKKKRRRPCQCKLVGCERVPQDQYLHITAINLMNVGANGKLPKSMGDLRYLRALNLNGNHVDGRLPRSMLTLTRFEVLVVAMNNPPTNWGHLTKSLKRLSLSFDPEAKPAPEVLTGLCSLQSLELLELEGAAGAFPDCLGGLSRLIRMKLLSNRPAGPIPAAWGHLRQLRVFIAFHNGEEHCPPPDGAFACRMKSIYFAELSPSENPFVCTRHALRGPLHPKLQGWKNIEKVWLDANWLTGTIPEWIGHKWRRLRRLDLHDNAFSGTVPPSLALLPNLESLQMQHNQLSGTLPPQLARVRHLTHFNAGLNPGLSGCIPRFDFRTAVVLSGTALKGLCPRAVVV